MKRCFKCDNLKALDDFSSDKSRTDGKQAYCKQCNAQYRKDNKAQVRCSERNWRNLHKESIHLKNKAHYLQNREKRLAYVREYVKRNKAKVYKYHQDYDNSHPNALLRRALRSRLRQAIKGQYKSGSAVRDLGCSIEEFKKYLESQFQTGMTWDNHGEWHIDHIKPLSSFDLTNRDELLLACHYTNLQPLWATDNLAKGSAYVR